MFLALVLFCIGFTSTFVRSSRHILDRPTHVFNGFLGTGQETLPINEVTGMSRDNVGLCFDAAITVQVVDGSKAVPILGGGQRNQQEASSFRYETFRNNIIQKVNLTMVPSVIVALVMRAIAGLPQNIFEQKRYGVVLNIHMSHIVI